MRLLSQQDVLKSICVKHLRFMYQRNGSSAKSDVAVCERFLYGQLHEDLCVPRNITAGDSRSIQCSCGSCWCCAMSLVASGTSLGC